MAGKGPRMETGTHGPVPPPIAAAFMVKFDHRKGYTIAWQESVNDVKVEGVVEFKSLPSGLHRVEEDLVYFVQDDYCGISAFVNRPDTQSARNASMLAVGVLVPLDHGRLGRSWRHAEDLKELARKQIENPADTRALEEYWSKYKIARDQQQTQPPTESPSELTLDKQDSQRQNGYRKSRSMSIATTFLAPSHVLTPNHPASALLQCVKLFGPLIFPLFRAALLRKRILIVGEPPVEFNCKLVYIMSILSSVSSSLLPVLSVVDIPNLRLRPLFNVGVSDIPQLEKRKVSPGTASYTDYHWIACTTDDVLGTKPGLYDLLVLLPTVESRDVRPKVYPKMVISSPDLAKAFPQVGLRSTQRDFDRYIHLQAGLSAFPPSHVVDAAGAETTEDDAASASSDTSTMSADKAVVEPASWSKVAYTSLVWWASAGDRRSGLTETDEMDRERDMALLAANDDDERTREVALVAYFRNMTSTIFTTIGEAIRRADGREDEEGEYHDDDDEDNGLGVEAPESAPPHREFRDGDEEETEALLPQPDEVVEVTSDDMAVMGFDIWSAADRKFVEELVDLWWGRKAVVRGGTIECCGVRIL